MRIGQVPRHEHQIGAHFLQQRTHQGHVFGSDWALAHLAGSVERQVEEPCGAVRQAHRFDRRDRLRLADHSLQVLDHGQVDCPRRLALEARLHRVPHAPHRRAVDAQRIGRPIDEVEVALHVVVEHGDIAAGHVGHHDRVLVLPQFAQDAAHRDHVVVRMR